ncbi:unnamed protein product, partial [Musa acuminata subsp. burmannicoides]
CVCVCVCIKRLVNSTRAQFVCWTRFGIADELIYGCVHISIDALSPNIKWINHAPNQKETRINVGCDEQCSTCFLFFVFVFSMTTAVREKVEQSCVWIRAS